jgi:hypothetical protein
MKERPARAAAFALLLAGVALLALAIGGLKDELRLRGRGLITEAAVTDWRVSGRKFQVRYLVHIPGSGVFSRTESVPWTRRNLWSSLPQPEWERTRTDPKVLVRYLLADPGINRPESENGIPWGYVLSGLLGLALTGFFSAVLLSRRLRSKLRGRGSP